MSLVWQGFATYHCVSRSQRFSGMGLTGERIVMRKSFSLGTIFGSELRADFKRMRRGVEHIPLAGEN
jgi:hypothetical protein